MGNRNGMSARWGSYEVPAKVALRAASKYEIEQSGCWVSTYSRGSHGYAQVGWSIGGGRSRMVLAHRAAWVHHHGQIPPGMTLDHTCKNRPCVNPAHLRMLTNFENARRTAGRDWTLGECARGHPNSRLYRNYRGALECRDCHNAVQRRSRARKLAMHMGGVGE